MVSQIGVAPDVQHLGPVHGITPTRQDAARPRPSPIVVNTVDATPRGCPGTQGHGCPASRTEVGRYSLHPDEVALPGASGLPMPGMSIEKPSARPKPRPPSAPCSAGPATIPDREGLLDTPTRVTRSYARSCSRATRSTRAAISSRMFEEVGGYDELVILRDIPFVSFCEHHMLPVVGKAHVGYLPTNRVVGISKLARVVHGFARRLPDPGEADRPDRPAPSTRCCSPQGVGRGDRGRAQLHDPARGQHPRRLADHHPA